MKTAVAWFEIPVVDFNRAKKFYEAVIDESLTAVSYTHLTLPTTMLV